MASDDDTDAPPDPRPLARSPRRWFRDIPPPDALPRDAHTLYMEELMRLCPRWLRGWHNDRRSGSLLSDDSRMNEWLQDAFLWALERHDQTGRMPAPAETADAVNSRGRKRRASPRRMSERAAQLTPDALRAVTTSLAVAPPVSGIRRHGAGTAGVLAEEGRTGPPDPKHKRCTLADDSRPTTLAGDRRLVERATASPTPVGQAIANEERRLWEQREAERVAAERAMKQKAAKLKWARKNRAAARRERQAAANVKPAPDLQPK